MAHTSDVSRRVFSGQCFGPVPALDRVEKAHFQDSPVHGALGEGLLLCNGGKVQHLSIDVYSRVDEQKLCSPRKIKR